MLRIHAWDRYSQDDLHLRLNDQRVSHGEAIQDFGELHELFPAPVVLLLTESMQGVCREGSNTVSRCAMGHLASLEAHQST